MLDNQYTVIHFKSQTTLSFSQGKVHLHHRNWCFGEISYQYQFPWLRFFRIICTQNSQYDSNVDLPVTRKFNIFYYGTLWYAKFSKQLLRRDQGPSCLYIISFQLPVWRDKVLSSLNIWKRYVFRDVFRTSQSINDGDYFLQHSWCQEAKV